MGNRIRLPLMIFVIFLPFSEMLGYDNTSLSNEQVKIMQFRNEMTRGLICSYLNMKKIQPVLDISGRQTFSVDVSYGYLISPSFFYNLNKNEYSLFGEEETIFTHSETRGLNLSVGSRLFSRFILTATFSYLPKMQFENFLENNFKANINVYYNFIKDALFLTGLSIGFGYNYTYGEINVQNNLSKLIDSTNVYFSGDLSSYWNYNGINVSLFANNQLLIFNFWGRVDYYILFGEIKSEFKGRNTFSTYEENLLNDKSLLQGVVLSGGMEVAFGWFKINVEAGRDILSSGMYANAGIRIGY